MKFAMFSTAGDKACESLTKAAIRKIKGKQKVTKESLEEFLRAKIAKVSEKHSEVYDSEPPMMIAFRVNDALEEAGYSFEVDRYKICFQWEG